jgi:hypothetical protein
LKEIKKMGNTMRNGKYIRNTYGLWAKWEIHMKYWGNWENM